MVSDDASEKGADFPFPFPPVCNFNFYLDEIQLNINLISL